MKNDGSLRTGGRWFLFGVQGHILVYWWQKVGAFLSSHSSKPESKPRFPTHSGSWWDNNFLRSWRSLATPCFKAFGKEFSQDSGPVSRDPPFKNKKNKGEGGGKKTARKTTTTTTTTTTNNKQQTTNNKQQTTNNKQQTTNNKQQTTNNKQQTTNNKQQTTNNKQQTTNNKQQTTNKQQQQTTNNKQQTTNNQPTTNQQQTNNKQPTTNNQQPTTNNQQPTTNNQQQQQQQQHRNTTDLSRKCLQVSHCHCKISLKVWYIVRSSAPDVIHRGGQPRLTDGEMWIVGGPCESCIFLVGGWTTQPLWKNMLVKLDDFPKLGTEIKDKI